MRLPSAFVSAQAPPYAAATVLSGIQSLLSHPNADDGLMSDIAKEYKQARQVFDDKARQFTRERARAETIGSAPALGDPAAEGEESRALKRSAEGEGELPSAKQPRDSECGPRSSLMG